MWRYYIEEPGDKPTDLEVLHWFLMSVEQKRGIPEWVTSRLYNVFSKYVDAGYSGDNRKLEDFFKIKKKDFENRERKRYFMHLCDHIDGLCQQFRMSQDDAITLVLANMHYHSFNVNGVFNLGICREGDTAKPSSGYIGHAGLDSIYKKHRKKTCNWPVHCWSSGEKSFWLQTNFKQISPDLIRKYNLDEYL